MITHHVSFLPYPTNPNRALQGLLPLLALLLCRGVECISSIDFRRRVIDSEWVYWSRALAEALEDAETAG